MTTTTTMLWVTLHINAKSIWRAMLVAGKAMTDTVHARPTKTCSATAAAVFRVVGGIGTLAIAEGSIKSTFTRMPAAIFSIFAFIKALTTMSRMLHKDDAIIAADSAVSLRATIRLTDPIGATSKLTIGAKIATLPTMLSIVAQVDTAIATLCSARGTGLALPPANTNLPFLTTCSTATTVIAGYWGNTLPSATNRPRTADTPPTNTRSMSPTVITAPLTMLLRTECDTTLQG